MPTFECNGCQTGPCIQINFDPEFEIDETVCTKKEAGNLVRAVWRELRVIG